eukprot:scaffold307485_cov31-Tisochrysis_lutea.AAC.4
MQEARTNPSVLPAEGGKFAATSNGDTAKSGRPSSEDVSCRRRWAYASSSLGIASLSITEKEISGRSNGKCTSSGGPRRCSWATRSFRTAAEACASSTASSVSSFAEASRSSEASSLALGRPSGATYSRSSCGLGRAFSAASVAELTLAG